MYDVGLLIDSFSLSTLLAVCRQFKLQYRKFLPKKILDHDLRTAGCGGKLANDCAMPPPFISNSSIW